MLWIRGIGNFKNIQNSIDVLLVIYEILKKNMKIFKDYRKETLLLMI